uniref:Uncharacterized protein n=1 Tax=Clastoptera arizonana TaxID=38151 RepID=A0A1B6BXT2_9HEMI
MTLLYGFNKFGQLDYLKNSYGIYTENCPCTNIIDKIHISFSWNYCVCYVGGELNLSGFLESKSHSLKKVVVPNHEKIIKVSCSRKHCLILTEKGKCWKYSPSENSLSNLTNLIFSEDNEQSFITNIDCKGSQNVATTSTGA